LETDTEKTRLGFEKMTRGWVKGSADFKKSVLEDLKDEQIQRVVESEASEMREPRWEPALGEALSALGRSDSELPTCQKGEGWKVDIARHLRDRHLTPYRWISVHLHMGAPSYVQSLVSRSGKQGNTKEWEALQKQGKLDL